MFKAFHDAVFSYGAVRFNRQVNRTAPHSTILPLTKPHRTVYRRILEKKQPAPHRTVKKRKRTAPHRRNIKKETKNCTALHRRIWWPSVEQAFLMMRTDLIRRKKTPHTVSSNYVVRAKCHRLYKYGDSD